MTIAETGSWAIGSVAGIIFTALLVLSTPVLIWWGRHVLRGIDSDLAWLPFAGAGITTLLIAVMLSPVALYPYKGEYHQWRHVAGTVAEIEKRLVGTGGGMEEKFVVTFTGSPQEWRVDDTRASLVEVGDELTIACRRVWEYAATHGYVCKWIGVES